ncbi:MAG: hypothetical protein ABJZ69_15400 [Hyphomicrobiales bacterium]
MFSKKSAKPDASNLFDRAAFAILKHVEEKYSQRMAAKRAATAERRPIDGSRLWAVASRRGRTSHQLLAPGPM